MDYDHLKVVKDELDPDIEHLSLDDNQEENATPRDDLLTDGDMIGSPAEFELN